MTANTTRDDLDARVSELEAWKRDHQRPRPDVALNMRDLSDCRRLTKIQHGQVPVYNVAIGGYEPRGTIAGSVRGTVNQTIVADNVDVTLRFNQILEMAGLTWDAANNEFMVATPGRYYAEIHDMWSISPRGARILHVMKNPRGTPTAAVVLCDSHLTPGGDDAMANGYGTEPVSNHGSRVVTLAAGDRIGGTVEKRTDAFAPDIMSIVAGDQFSPVMTLTYLGPAPAPPTAGSWVLGPAATPTTRNNFSGEVGCRFVPRRALTVTHLARWKFSGNSQTHTVKLVRASDLVVLGSVTVNLSSGSAGTMIATALGTPVALAAGTTYFLVSTETSGGDFWADIWPMAYLDQVADMEIGAFRAGSSGAFTLLGSRQSYGPSSFTFTT